jgi:hypothetical protein
MCSSSKNDTDDSNISIVADSPSKNTRAASSTAWPKKNSPPGKKKPKSRVGQIGKKKNFKHRHLPTMKSNENLCGSMGGKSSNFTSQEHNMLAKAFVNISMNPIHGSGMNSNDFWDNVHQKWIELVTTEENCICGVETSRSTPHTKRHEPMECVRQARLARKPVQSEQYGHVFTFGRERESYGDYG